MSKDMQCPNTDDLISRKGVLLTLSLFQPDQNGYPLNAGIQYARAMIEAAPKMDAAFVEHGKWLIDEYDSGEPGCYAAYIEVHCSECGYGLGAESGQYGWSDGSPFPLHFCPNCGAKMDRR